MTIEETVAGMICVSTRCHDAREYLEGEAMRLRREIVELRDTIYESDQERIRVVKLGETQQAEVSALRNRIQRLQWQSMGAKK